MSKLTTTPVSACTLPHRLFLFFLAAGLSIGSVETALVLAEKRKKPRLSIDAVLKRTGPLKLG
jgi:hypothetical protein